MKRAAELAAAQETDEVVAYDAVQNMDFDDRCIMMAGTAPPMLSPGYMSNYQIVQAPGYVMILVERIHDARIIPLDGRPHPPAERSPVDWELARPLGGQYAGCRDTKLQQQAAGRRRSGRWPGSPLPARPRTCV